MESGIIKAQGTSVVPCEGKGLLLCAPRRVVLDNPNRQRVLLAGKQLLRHIKAATHESAFNAADPFAIQEDVRLPIDPVEIQPGSLITG